MPSRVSAPRLIELRGQPIAGGKLPLICTPLVGSEPDAVLAELAAILPKQPDLLEWRVDPFDRLLDAAAVIETAAAIRAAAGGIPLLFTRRSPREGGFARNWSEDAVLRVHEQVCASGWVDLVDWELSGDAQHFERLRAVTRAHGQLLVASHHNFQATPAAEDIEAWFAQAEHRGADVAKVAVMPSGPQDVLTLLAATLAASQRLSLPLISMAMGPYGSLSRMLGWVYGSTVTFAVGQEASAPGQMPIADLRAVLNISRAAVLGGGAAG